MDERMKTYAQELLWFGEDEQGTFFAVVIAPDDETAEKLIALEMLQHHEAGLEGCESLKEFYDEHTELGGWGDLKGTACPNCTAHCGREASLGLPAGEVVLKVLECSTCGYTWAPLGFGKRRDALEESVRVTIANMDEIERKLVAGEEDEPPAPTPEEALVGHPDEPEVEVRGVGRASIPKSWGAEGKNFID